MAKVALIRVPDEAEATKAKAQEQRILKLHKLVGQKWTELAAQIADFDRNRRWAQLGHKSFNAWTVAHGIRTKLYEARKLGAALREIAGEDLEQITEANARLLAKVPESQRRELLEKAKNMTERDFAKEPAVVEHQGEAEVWRRYCVPASLADRMDLGHKVAAWLEGSIATEVTLEAIYQGFLSAQYEGDGAVVGESNEEAYRKRGGADAD